MSARHLQALRGPSLEPPAHTPSDEEEEEEEEEEARGQTGGGFGLLLASSDEEDEDEDDEDWAQDQGEEEEQQEPAPAPAPAKQVTPQPKKAPPPPPPAKQVDEEDDDVWLEIQRQQEGGGLDTTATPAVGTSSKKRAAKPPVVPLALAFDTRCLNLEHELKFRFGAEGVMPGGAEGGGGGGNRRRGGAIGGARGGAGGGVLTQLYNRRCFFGPPKEDWPRPPTYVGGGLRMVRVEAPADCRDPEEAARDWYAFEWSPSFQALQQDYERVVATCDPNALAIWLAHNPHYVDGLLTLALVLAAHGQMDRAHDHIRRCLFTFEAAGYLESFRSSFLGSTTGGGPRAVDCRMDVRRPENRPFFMAMFRHVQMLGGRGLYQTAFEVAKFLLALDPLGDPTGILLCLDFYAISAGKKEQLLAMMEAGFPIGTGWTEGEEEEDEEEEASDDEDDLGTRRRTASPPSLTVRALPNMCYSCALAMFLGSRNNATLRIQARDALRDALLRFPVVLTPLVEKCRNELGSRITQPWDQVLRHLFFANAESRLPPGCVLPRLAAVYTQRSYDLWGGDPEAMQFLFDGAWEVLGEVDQGSWGYKEEAQELVALYEEGSPLDKYRQVDSADFRDEFARLPPELNPLDPALADPAVARRGRLRFRRGMLGGRAGVQPPALWGEADHRRTRGNLDPNLPLMELFWRSLLPWNTIDPSLRHRR